MKRIDSTCGCGTAYIIETRSHPNLPLVLENTHKCLPMDWVITVFCSIENQLYVQDSIVPLVGRKVMIKLLDTTLNSLQDYNDLLFSESFWQSFETENLLGFQTDSWFNIKQKEALAEICDYDYVGAPWSKGIQKRWSYIPSYGGNGGICFSKRSARLKALSQSIQPRISSEPHNQILNEDIWFSHAIKSTGGRLASRKKSSQWFVESVYTPTPFGVHKPWSYISEHDYQELLKELPDLAALRAGCDVKKQVLKSQDKDQYRHFLLRFARTCLAADNFYQADLALQVCQRRYPDHPSSYNLQAVLAHNLGLYGQASTFVNQALKRAPKFKRALDNKNFIEHAIAEQEKTRNKPSQQESRYLLIHSWGSGLGFDLLYLLKQLMVAELTHRQPLVYWGVNSLYNDHPESDCFIDYFESISKLTLKDIEPYQDNCFPIHWQDRQLSDFIRRTRWRNTKNNQQYSMTGLYYLNRDESLVISGEFTSIKTLIPWVPKSHRFYGMSVNDIYRDLMIKYIKPKKYLQERVNSVIKTAFRGKPFIAIHLRGTDKKQEKQSSDIASINQQLIEQLIELDDQLPIFVMTDDVRQISAIQQRLGDRVYSVDVTRSDGDELGIHHTASDKQKIAEEVIVDMLIAAQSLYFFGCGFSYLACCVAVLRPKSAQTILQPFNVMTRFVDIPTPGTFSIE